MKHIFLLLMLAVQFPNELYSQTREISCEYTYYADPNLSVKEAKIAAIDQAKVAALAKEFGTFITQDLYSQESNDNNYVTLLSNVEVKGEWLVDIQEPEVKIIDTDGDVLVLRARVRGKARPIKNNAAEFDVLALRNGTNQRFADTNFKDGDKMYLYFKAPADGYVAVYLIDEQNIVTCLIPHEGDGDGQQPVKHGQNYIFFSEQYDSDFKGSDGLVVTCDDERLELNRIYVIYSPNSFVKANDHAGQQLENGNLHRPRQLSLKDFSSWMSKLYARDKNMARRVIRIRISK